MNILNDISKVYLETIATEAAKPDYLDFDKDGNKKESMKKALKDKKEVAEAVRGQDTEMRKAASAERRAGDTLTKKLPPSEGKNYGKYQGHQISYIDKKTKGKHIPGMTRESLDPVGKEDKDIDNDGDHDKSDKYLLNRRKVRGTAIATRKESFSNWRQDLSEVMDKIEKDDDHKQIKEKKNINNKIVINPDFKEAVEELGGILLEAVEVDEAYKPIDRDKENRMYRRAGNLARTAVSSTGKKKEVAQTKSSKIVSAITRQKEKERFNRIGQSPAHNEEVEYVNEAGASKEAESKFHSKLDTMVHKTFGKRPEEKKMKEEIELEEKKGLWDNIHAKRKRGERSAKPGEKDYPKTLNVEENELEEGLKQARKNVGASKCWTGKKVGNPPTKMKGGKEVPNCVPEEVELDEKTLTPAETKKKEEIVMSMKKKGDFSKYGERAKEVMYATATKQAKKLAEADMPQETQGTDKRAKVQQKQKLLQILQQKERAVRAGMTDISASYEVEGEQLDERRREEKGTPRKPRDKAFELISKSMGAGRMGVQPRGKKKVPGEKKPSTQITPAEKVKRRRDSAQRAQDMMHSPRD
jgi:hypothetical protein